MAHETSTGRSVFVLGRSAVLDAAEVATRAAAQRTELLLLSLGYPVSPEQDAVVQAALRGSCRQAGLVRCRPRSVTEATQRVRPRRGQGHTAHHRVRAEEARTRPGDPESQRQRPTSPILRPGVRSAGSPHGSAGPQATAHDGHSPGGVRSARRSLGSGSTIFPLRQLGPIRCRRRRGLGICRGARRAGGPQAHPRHRLVTGGSAGAEAGSTHDLPRRGARRRQDLRDAR